MLVTSFQEELMLAPANPTSAFNNPFGPISYGASIPVGFGGLGDVIRRKGNTGLGQGVLAALSATNPVLAATSAGLSIASLIASFTQPSQTGIFKQDATTLVNGLVAELNSVAAALKANPTCANQQAAINYFWTAWNELVQGCAQFGGPGTACVNDRAQGGKYSWWTLYLNPWTNMACTSTPASSSTAASGTATSSISPILLLVGAGLLAFAFMGQGSNN
jgi:hypothetical protein